MPSIDELLQQIQAVHDEGWDNPNRAIPPFAALLVKLSREASETAGKNIRIQWGMLWVTIVILVISLVQLGMLLWQQH